MATGDWRPLGSPDPANNNLVPRPRMPGRTTNMNDGASSAVREWALRWKEVLTEKPRLKAAIISGALIGKERYVIGTEEGLLYVDGHHEVVRCGKNKSVFQIEYLVQARLLAVVCGRRRHLRLVPEEMLDGADVEWLKLEDTKGCSGFTVGLLHEPTADSVAVYCLCVPMKRKVRIFEITSGQAGYRQLKAINLPVPAQCLNVISEGRIIIGYPSCFVLRSIMADHHLVVLARPDIPPLSFVSHHPLDSMCAVEMKKTEYLLAFSKFALYVDHQGRTTRERKILFSAKPTAIVHNKNSLLVFTKTHIDIVCCSSGVRTQTLNLKLSVPLNCDGLLVASFATEKPYVIYLRDMHQDVCVTENASKTTGDDNLDRVIKLKNGFLATAGSPESQSSSGNRGSFTATPTQMEFLKYKYLWNAFKYGAHQGVHEEDQ